MCLRLPIISSEKEIGDAVEMDGHEIEITRVLNGVNRLPPGR